MYRKIKLTFYTSGFGTFINETIEENTENQSTNTKIHSQNTKRNKPFFRTSLFFATFAAKFK